MAAQDYLVQYTLQLVINDSYSYSHSDLLKRRPQSHDLQKELAHPDQTMGFTRCPGSSLLHRPDTSVIYGLPASHCCWQLTVPGPPHLDVILSIYLNRDRQGWRNHFSRSSIQAFVAMVHGSGPGMSDKSALGTRALDCTHIHTPTHKLVIMVNKTTKSHLISLSPDYPRWTSSRNVQFISAQQHHYHRYCRTNSHSSFPFVITMHSITWFYCKIIHNLAGLADLNHWF